MFTYRQYILNKHASSKTLQSYYTQGQYLDSYPLDNGFSDYLESIRGQDLSLVSLLALGRALAKYGKRSAEQMPTLLSGVARSYDLSLPVVEGVLTENYWTNRI